MQGHVGVSTQQRAVRAALEALYRHRYAEFVRVATAITGSEARAVDAVQETFARALGSLGSFREDGPLAAWVWRILVNTSRDHARKVELVSDDLVPVALESAVASGGDEFGVRCWVSSLPERQRLAVFLRYYGECDYRAIAEALDVEVGTVSATLSAAHSSLRRMLKEVAS